MMKLGALSAVAVVLMAGFSVNARLESQNDTLQWHVETREMSPVLAISLMGGYLAGALVILLNRDEIDSLKGIAEALKGLKNG